MSAQIIRGDALTELRRLPAESVHCCVTSPPYWGLRDYGVDGQRGLEATPEEYVYNMTEIFREVRRVLRDDGTLWLNIGDSYASGEIGRNDGYNPTGSQKKLPKIAPAERANNRAAFKFDKGLKPKDLVGIPWRVAFALQADGWYLRQDIIWAKPNPMPESVRDRCTKAHEYIFLLAKSERYYYDADAIKADSDRGGEICGTGPKSLSRGSAQGANVNPSGNAKDGGFVVSPERANKRSVWTVATQPYSGAHFATFPPALIEPCILAGCPANVCAKCGAPWERRVERTPASITTGFFASCACGTETSYGVVLDPFGGAGTTGLVADRLQRDSILIELNPEYAAMAERRIRGDSPLFAEVA